jgi:hypothetical protein
MPDIIYPGPYVSRPFVPPVCTVLYVDDLVIELKNLTCNHACNAKHTQLVCALDRNYTKLTFNLNIPGIIKTTKNNIQLEYADC